MIYYLGNLLLESFASLSFLRLVNYISFRAIAAALTAFAFNLLWGQKMINLLYLKGMRDMVRDYGAMAAHEKRGTPTMGGTIIVASILVGVLLWCDLANRFTLIFLAALVWFALLGAWDDILKIRHGDSDQGLSQGKKLLAQVAFGGLLGLVYLSFYSPVDSGLATKLYLPFIKVPVADLGWIYGLFIAFTVTAVANSVNFADGLDGLAIVPATFAVAVYGVFAYVLGNKIYSEYLQFFYLPGSGELTVMCATLFGAGLGFLWFNAYPAQVFMGDVGSMALGGLLGTLAVLLKQEFLFLIVGGVFVAEAFSVLVQEKIGINRLGRRIFYRAPLHHTFQYQGLAETKVVVRFWIVAGILALIGLATLKIR